MARSSRLNGPRQPDAEGQRQRRRPARWRRAPAASGACAAVSMRSAQRRCCASRSACCTCCAMPVLMPSRSRNCSGHRALALQRGRRPGRASGLDHVPSCARQASAERRRQAVVGQPPTTPCGVARRVVEAAAQHARRSAPATAAPRAPCPRCARPATARAPMSCSARAGRVAALRHQLVSTEHRRAAPRRPAARRSGGRRTAAAAGTSRGAAARRHAQRGSGRRAVAHRHLAAQRVRQRPAVMRTSTIWPTRRGGAGEVDDAVALGAAHQLGRVLARGAFDQDALHRADAAGADAPHVVVEHAPAGAAGARSLTSCGVSSCSAAAGVPGRGLKMKLKLASKPTSSISFIILAKSSSVSPGKPTMKSLDSASCGPDGAQLAHRALVFHGGVAALHRHQDAVAAVLHRQVQVAHQLGHLARRPRSAAA